MRGLRMDMSCEHSANWGARTPRGRTSASAIVDEDKEHDDDDEIGNPQGRHSVAHDDERNDDGERGEENQKKDQNEFVCQKDYTKHLLFPGLSF